MMNEKRVNEIISQITAFSKDTYCLLYTSDAADE